MPKLQNKIIKYEDYDLLGFDIRLSMEDYVHAIWNKKSRDEYLLRPEIEWLLSVDTMIWPSFFRYSTGGKDSSYFYFEEGLDVDVTTCNSLHSAFDLWQDSKEMETYFLKQKNKLLTNGIEIAVVLFKDESLKCDEFWSAVLDFSLSTKSLKKDWIFLGYDVADRDLISGLSNCGYSENEKRILQKEWKTLLNKYGLLGSLKDAKKFKKICDQRVVEHAPFYIYGLFKKGEGEVLSSFF